MIDRGCFGDHGLRFVKYLPLLLCAQKNARKGIAWYNGCS